MTGMTPERLAEIRTRAEAATEGPWEATWEEGDDWWSITGAPQRVGAGGPWAVCPEVATSDARDPADATFIAAARTDVPELVAEVERLQARVGPCDGGCNYETGPEETCSLHGRPVAEVWQIVNDVAAERDARINALAQHVEKVRALHVNEWVIHAGVGGFICAECREPVESEPCATIRALDGPE